MDIAAIAGIAIASVVAFNVLMGGVVAALEKLAPETETELDDKALGFLNKYVPYLKKLAEILVAMKPSK